MGVRAALIRDWRERSQADEAQVALATPRAAWLLRARARIYRVLLAMYGHGDWRADCPDTRETEFHAVPLAAGRPPKSSGEIRKTLKAVRSAVESSPAGDGSNGAQPARSLTFAGWTIVLTSHSRPELSAACCLLRVRGIHHAVLDHHILVVETDRERALASLASERRVRANLRNRDLDVNNRRARFNLILLLSLLAGCFATFVVIPRLRSPQNWQPAEIAAAYFAASAFWVAAVLCLNAARKRWR